jgi:hypothetical protein
VSKVPKFYFEDCPPAKPAKVAKHYSGEAPQASPPACPVTCAAACHWYASNPWSHDPTLFGWCHRWMEPLGAGSPACEEFNRGEVPLKATPNKAPQTPAPGERILTCADCGFHKYTGPNPAHGWGRCTLKKRGCYGLRPACSEIPRDTWGG